MRDDKSPRHSKGGGTGRTSQLEGILLEHFDLYIWCLLQMVLVVAI